MDNVMNQLKNVLHDSVMELKSAPMQPTEDFCTEMVTFDYSEKDNTKWRELIREKLATAKTFEIHCWCDEVEEIILAVQFGEVKPSDWKKGTIIKGNVTPEFVKMLLDRPKPEEIEIYNKMTPFFTINLDNGFSSAHYGTEVYL